MKIFKGNFEIKDNFYTGIYGNKYSKGKIIFGVLWYSSKSATYFCRAKLGNSSVLQDVSVNPPKEILSIKNSNRRPIYN